MKLAAHRRFVFRQSGLCLMVVACLVAIENRAAAQVTVQQPVISTFGGRFAVSVPDRGTAFIGGIGRAGESRGSYGGPFSLGSSRGRFTQHTGLSSSVYIHDLREMDQMVLDAADSSSASRLSGGSSLSSRASMAYRADGSSLRPAFREDDFLQTRSPQSVIGLRGSRPIASSSPAADRGSADRASRALDAERAFRLGREAEVEGRIKLARLHYDLAARQGFAPARDRLKELDGSGNLAASSL